MARGYWIGIYRSVSDPDALARYAALAPSVIAAQGGRVLARGIPAQVFEGAEAQRCVVIEFDSVAAAIAAYESAAYQEVRSILDGAVVREIRMVEGV